LVSDDDRRLSGPARSWARCAGRESRRRRLAGNLDRVGHGPGGAVRRSSPGEHHLHRHRAGWDSRWPQPGSHRRPGRAGQDAGDRLGRGGVPGGPPAPGSIATGRLHRRPRSVRKEVHLTRGHRARRGGFLAWRGTVKQGAGCPEVHFTNLTHHGSICRLAAQPPNRGQDTMTTTYHIADIRNIALAGHGASGKTSLADALLFAAGAIARKGSVDEGTSTLDIDAKEKRRHF